MGRRFVWGEGRDAQALLLAVHWGILLFFLSFFLSFFALSDAKERLR